MSIRAQVAHERDNLSDVDLEQVAEYVTFLKFLARVGRIPALEEIQLSALYSQFSDEDRKLAEEGLSDYPEGLAKEDIV